MGAAALAAAECDRNAAYARILTIFAIHKLRFSAGAATTPLFLADEHDAFARNVFDERPPRNYIDFSYARDIWTIIFRVR